MASLGYTVTCFHKRHVPKPASLAPGTKLNFPDLGKPSREIPNSMPFFFNLGIFFGGGEIDPPNLCPLCHLGLLQMGSRLPQSQIVRLSPSQGSPQPCLQ